MSWLIFPLWNSFDDSNQESLRTALFVGFRVITQRIEPTVECRQFEKEWITNRDRILPDCTDEMYRWNVNHEYQQNRRNVGIDFMPLEPSTSRKYLGMNMFHYPRFWTHYSRTICKQFTRVNAAFSIMFPSCSNDH